MFYFLKAFQNCFEFNIFYVFLKIYLFLLIYENVLYIFLYFYT